MQRTHLTQVPEVICLDQYLQPAPQSRVAAPKVFVGLDPRISSFVLASQPTGSFPYCHFIRRTEGVHREFVDGLKEDFTESQHNLGWKGSSKLI